MSRPKEPRHHPPQPTASAESPVLVDEVAKHERSNSADDHGPRRSGAPRAQELNSAQRALPEAKPRSAATRVRRVPWRDSARRVPWRVLVLDALSAAETLVPRFCDSNGVDPAEWATREFEAGDPAALRLGDVDRGGLRGRTRRCEAARSAAHSAAALLRAPAQLVPADAAESAALHNVFAILLRRLGADPRS